MKYLKSRIQIWEHVVGPPSYHPCKMIQKTIVELSTVLDDSESQPEPSRSFKCDASSCSDDDQCSKMVWRGSEQYSTSRWNSAC